MKKFVNYWKRGVELPKGSKDLADLLKAPKQFKRARSDPAKIIRKSKCDYCGAPAVAGFLFGEGHFWCKQCGDDVSEFYAKPENRPPRRPEHFDLKDPMAIKELEQLLQELEQREAEFMRQKVAARKGPDPAA
jgi:hypothetical protein